MVSPRGPWENSDFPSSPSSREVWLLLAALGISQAATLRLCAPSLPACTERCLFCTCLQIWACQSIPQRGTASALARGSTLAEHSDWEVAVFPQAARPHLFWQCRHPVWHNSRAGRGWAAAISSSEKGREMLRVIQLLKASPDKGMAYGLSVSLKEHKILSLNLPSLNLLRNVVFKSSHFLPSLFLLFIQVKIHFCLLFEDCLMFAKHFDIKSVT